MESLSLAECYIGLIEAFGAPRPTSFGLGELLAALQAAIAEFGGGQGPTVKSVLNFGGDPNAWLTNVESTEAFNLAVAALPTITVSNDGHVHTVPYGTITGGGYFIINREVQLNAWGPWVQLDGLGFTFLDDHNSVACGYAIDLTNPFGFPGDTPVVLPQAGPQLQYWTGGLHNGVILDGTNCTGGGNGGIIGGSGENCRIEAQVQNYTGGTGIWVNSFGAAWAESLHVDAQMTNNFNAIVFGGYDNLNRGSNSSGQGRYWIRNMAYPGQNGVVVQNGAWVYNSDVRLTGAMFEGIVTRSFSDGVLVAGSLTLTSATADFAVDDTGRPVSGGTIPPGAVIATVVSSTQVTLSTNHAPTASATGVSVVIGYPERSVTDGVTTMSSNQISSATADFTTADLGVVISGTGIAPGSIITQINSSTTVTLNYEATASGTGITFNIGTGKGVSLTVQGPNAIVQWCHLDFRLELDALSLAGGNKTPQTIHLDTANDCFIGNCDGALMFKSFGQTWTQTQPTVANGLNSYFSFAGWTQGDTSLSSGGTAALLIGPPQGS